MKNFSESLKVIGTEAKGRGVISALFVAKGSLVSPANGIRIHSGDILPHHMCLQIDHDQWLCSEGNFTDDFFNHSCEPNIGFADGTLNYYALRDIPEGEELCWDYSTSITETGWTLHCRCGQLNCRKVVTSFFELSTAEQQRLLPISLAYIRKLFAGQ